MTIAGNDAEWKAEQVIAGNHRALQALRELLLWPTLFSKEANILGLRWPKGLLLYGPPGTGKTSLVHAIVRECHAHLVLISAGLIHRAYAGESERILRDAFSEASSQVAAGRPAIIFIDEIDALCPHRNSRREQESRIVAQLLTLMDGTKSSVGSLERGDKTDLPYILWHLIAWFTKRVPETHGDSNGRKVVRGWLIMKLIPIERTTVDEPVLVNAIDPALRRAGRFDAEIEISAPNEEQRFQILQLHARNLPLDENVNLDAIASSCNGYVGADLEALCREAAMAALRKFSVSGEGDLPCITMEDWEIAKLKVGPSIVRGVVAEVPKVLWEDIGGLHDKKLRQAVEWPIKHAAAFARLGLPPPRGVLLHGPPGCSKTSLVKAAAHAAQANLFSLSGAELDLMYVGEGEAFLREIFQRARLAAPSIIFFDEVDAIAAKRGREDGNSATVGEKLLSTLLTEIYGLELTTGVLVLGATNRPEAIDSALLRPGRFDVVLYVPPPDVEERIEVLRVHTRNMNLSSDVDLSQIAHRTELFTGAELAGLCREAAILALREDIHAHTVSAHHFELATNSLRPSLTQLQIATYSSFMSKRKHRVKKLGTKNYKCTDAVYVFCGKPIRFL